MRLHRHRRRAAPLGAGLRGPAGEAACRLGQERGAKRARLLRERWKRFLQFYQGPPWKVTRLDVTNWVAWLAAQGMQPVSAASYVSTLSSFYTYCARTSPALFPGGKPFNPARGVHGRGKSDYQTASCLSAQEARLLLEAVDRQASPLGKRDYALLLACLLTGLHIGAIRVLRWGPIRSKQSTPRSTANPSRI
jgi:site-specific recombinase XerD